MANGLVTVCASDGVELYGVVSADLEVVDASYRQPLMRVTEFNKIYQGVKFGVEMRLDLREYRDRETQSGFLSFVDGATKFCGNVEDVVFQRTRAEACATDIGDSRWVRCRAGLTQESGCAVLASIFGLAGFKSNCYNSAGIYNPLIVVRLDAELESKKVSTTHCASTRTL